MGGVGKKKKGGGGGGEVWGRGRAVGLWQHGGGGGAGCEIFGRGGGHQRGFDGGTASHARPKRSRHYQAHDIPQRRLP